MPQTKDPKLLALSRRIDSNHEALEARLDTLYREREAASGGRRDELEAQIRQLRNQQIRLLKSKNAAWMAHWLRTEGEVEIVEHPHRKLGAALMLISALALLGLAIYGWQLNH